MHEPKTKKVEKRKKSKVKSKKRICSEVSVNSPGNPWSLFLCIQTSLNQEKSEFEKTVEKHELEMIAKRQELRQMKEDIERQKVILRYK